jgi:hypothetical protein
MSAPIRRRLVGRLLAASATPALIGLPLPI